MKIYYIANAFLPNPKAHGIQLAKMCEAFVKSGIDLKLVAPFRRGLTAQGFKEFYGLRELVPLQRLPVINIFPKMRFGFNLRALTFACSYFFYLLAKKIKGEQAIVYTIDLDQFSFFLIPFLGLPYFFEMHAAKRADRPHRFFFKKLRGAVVINSFIKSAAVKTFGLAGERILVFPNGIDLRLFGGHLEQQTAKEKLGLPRDSYAVVYIGRFYDWKGLDILVPTANFLPDKFVFYLVGGTQRQFLDITGESRLPANLVCVGERPYEEMPFWLAAADVLLVLGTRRNDYSWSQTSPMKLFEYLSVKRPIVASRTPAIQEIVSEKEVVFYEPDNYENLALSVRSAAENKAGLVQMIESGYEKVLNFTWEKRAAAIKNFISQKLVISN